MTLKFSIEIVLCELLWLRSKRRCGSERTCKSGSGSFITIPTRETCCHLYSQCTYRTFALEQHNTASFVTSSEEFTGMIKLNRRYYVRYKHMTKSIRVRNVIGVWGCH